MPRKPKDQTIGLEAASLKAAASPITVKAPGQQPRSVTSTDSQLIQPYYRAGMHAELQKFGRSDDNIRQLLLGEDTDLQDPNSLDIYGLDLDVSEDRPYTSQLILDSTDYQGNIPVERPSPSAFNLTAPPSDCLLLTLTSTRLRSQKREADIRQQAQEGS